MPPVDAEVPVRGQSVFLNVPYDPEYASLFIALIAITFIPAITLWLPTQLGLIK